MRDNSNIFLIFLFMIVMVVITLTNHIREAPARAELAAMAVADSYLNARGISDPRVLEGGARVFAEPTPKSRPLPLASPQILPIPVGEERSPRMEVLPPVLRASAYILMDQNGRILASHEERASLQAASLTKLMTAVVFQELFPHDGLLQISERALPLNVNTFGLEAGTTLNKRQALEFILLVSSNIVSESVAEAFGGVEFVTRMNMRAAELGMRDTFFTDASGLQDFSRSSARDLANLLQYIARNHPEILAISRVRYAVFNGHILPNTNELLGEVPGILGGKTGTNRAGLSLGLVFRWQDRTFFAVVLNSRDRVGDMRSLIEYAWNLR